MNYLSRIVLQVAIAGILVSLPAVGNIILVDPAAKTVFENCCTETGVDFTWTVTNRGTEHVSISIEVQNFKGGEDTKPFDDIITGGAVKNNKCANGLDAGASCTFQVGVNPIDDSEKNDHDSGIWEIPVIVKDPESAKGSAFITVKDCDARVETQISCGCGGCPIPEPPALNVSALGLAILIVATRSVRAKGPLQPRQ